MTNFDTQLTLHMIFINLKTSTFVESMFIYKTKITKHNI